MKLSIDLCTRVRFQGKLMYHLHDPSSGMGGLYPDGDEIDSSNSYALIYEDGRVFRLGVHVGHADEIEQLH